MNYFVNAKSGLYFRNGPNGNLLGYFKLNTHIEVFFKTKIVSEIKD